jgi:transposase-like protein
MFTQVSNFAIIKQFIVKVKVKDMQQEEMDFINFMDRFKTEEDCREHFFKIRWPSGFRCPKCGHEEYFPIKKRGLYECSRCGYQASVTAGTIMHRSHTGLREWFLVIYLFTNDKRGISATQVARMVGISHCTAWLMLHKLRKAMGDRDAKYYLDGIIEMDDAFFGAHDEGGKRGRGTNKTPAIVELSLNEDNQPEHLKIQVVDNVDGATIADMAKETINAGAKVRTDGLNAYNTLKSEGYEHEKEKFDPKNNPEHLHWLHVMVSNCKAFIEGTYHGLDKKHLQRYFDEFCYRFNRRHFGNQLFNRLLDACASTTTITYAQLVGLGVPELT